MMERLTERTHGSIADELFEEMENPIDSVFVKKEMYKDCRHICDKNELCDNCPLYEVMRKLADYEDAEEQGLFLKLPCKVGDAMWAIRHYRGVSYAQQGFVNEMFFSKEMKLIIVVKNIARGEFGKTVFLTKKEAEQALQKMKGGSK